MELQCGRRSVIGRKAESQQAEKKFPSNNPKINIIKQQNDRWSLLLCNY